MSHSNNRKVNNRFAAQRVNQPRSDFKPQLTESLNATLVETPADEERGKAIARYEAAVRGLMALTDFEILHEIGRGGMGIVFEAIEVSLNRRVALKALLPTAMLDGNHLNRFKREARAAAQLSHPNIVPVYHVGCERDYHFYVMQLIEGNNLATTIKLLRDHVDKHQHPSKSDTKAKAKSNTLSRSSPGMRPMISGAARPSPSRPRLDAEEFASAFAARRNHASTSRLYKTIAAFGAELADAIAHAHSQGIVHRDIKPSNILIDHSGHVWVTDFGLAIIQDLPNETHTGDIVGTLRYMSPEQASGRRFLVDHRTDVYSLGVTLYELVTLQKAFDGSTAQEILRKVTFEDPKRLRLINPSVPEELEIIIQKAMEKNPQDRYQSAEELAADLNRFAQDQPIRARRASLAKAAKRWIVRHQSLAVAAGIVIIFAFLTSLAASWAIWSSLIAEKEQRQIAENLLEKSEGLRLTAHSSLYAEKNPGLALALAREAALRTSEPEVNEAVWNALRNNHEQSLIALDANATYNLTISGSGKYCLITPVLNLESEVPPRVYEIESSRLVKELNMGQRSSSSCSQPGSDSVLFAFAPACNSRLPIPSDFTRAEPAVLLDIRPASKKHLTFSNSAVLLADPLAFSLDGKLVLLPCDDNSVALFDTQTGERHLRFQGHATQVARAVLSPDSKLAASVDISGKLHVWKTENADSILEITFPTSDVIRVAFNSDGSVLLVSRVGGTDFYGTNESSQDPFARSRRNRFAISPYRKEVVLYSDGSKELLLIEPRSQRVTNSSLLSTSPRYVNFSRSGDRIFAVTGNTVQVFDAALEAHEATFQGHESDIYEMDCDRLSDFVATASFDNTLRFWRTSTSEERMKLGPPLWEVIPTDRNLAIVNDLAIVGSAPLIETRFVDDQSFHHSEAFPGKTNRYFAFERKIATFQNEMVYVYDKASAKRLAEFRLRGFDIQDAVFIDHLNACFVVTAANQICAFNLTTGEMTWIELKQDIVRDCYFCKGGKSLVLGQNDGKVKVIDLETLKTIRSMQGPNPILRVLGMEGGAKIFAFDTSGKLLIWTGDDGSPTHEIAVADTPLNNVALSYDERLLFGAPWQVEGKLHCWDIASGELLGTHPLSASSRFRVHPSLPLVAIADAKMGTALWDIRESQSNKLSERIASAVGFLRDDVIAVYQQSFQPPQLNLSPSESFKTSTLEMYDLTTRQLKSSSKLNSDPLTLEIDPRSNQVYMAARSWRLANVDLRSNLWNYSSMSFRSPFVFITKVPKSTNIVVGLFTGEVGIYSTEENTFHKLASRDVQLTCSTVSPDGRFLAFGDTNGVVRLWDLANGKLVENFEAGKSRVVNIQFTDSSNELLIACRDSIVRKWDLRTKTVATLEFDGIVETISFSANAAFGLAVVHPARVGTADDLNATDDPAARIQNRAVVFSTEPLAILEKLSPRECTYARLSPDGNWIAYVAQSGPVTLTERTNPSRILELATNDHVLAVAFHPTRGLVATLGNHDASIWDIKSEMRLLSLPRSVPSAFLYVGADRFHWQPFYASESAWIDFQEKLCHFSFELNSFWNQFHRKLTNSERKLFRLEP